MMENIDSKFFFTFYNDALLCYEGYKKDFISVNLMHLKYVKEKNNVDKKLIEAKLKKLINLYTNQVNIKFSREVYSKCNFAWSNADLFIERNLWLCIQAIESDGEKMDTYESACMYYGNVENVLKHLSLEKIKIYNRPITEILYATKSRIEKMPGAQLNV